MEEGWREVKRGRGDRQQVDEVRGEGCEVRDGETDPAPVHREEEHALTTLVALMLLRSDPLRWRGEAGLAPIGHLGRSRSIAWQVRRSLISSVDWTADQM
jgi:hypothetical protein